MNTSSIHPIFPKPSRLASRVCLEDWFVGDGCGARGVPYKLKSKSSWEVPVMVFWDLVVDDE